MNKKNNYSYIPLLAGALLLLLVLNITSEARGMPVYDRDMTQDFRLSGLRYDDPAYADYNYEIAVTVTNRGEPGTMFVQCSILNVLAEGEFLTRAAQVDFLGPYDNCVNPEPFTQTAQIHLNNSESVDVVFTIRAPSDLGGDYRIYCEAFERCWSPTNENTGSTSQLVRPVSVVARPSGEVASAEDEDIGVVDEDGNVIGTVDLTNVGIRAWLRDNSIFAMMIAVVLLIIGGVLVYSEPKRSYMG